MTTAPDGATAGTAPGTRGVPVDEAADPTAREFAPEEPPLTEADRRQVRRHYGRVRAYFKLRPARYAAVQRRLNQARIGTTYDRYLASSVRYALVAGFVGLLLGTVLAAGLQVTGVLAALRSPVQFPGAIGAFAARNGTLLAGTVVALASAVTLGLGTWSLRVSYPRYVVGRRTRAVEVMLPHAIAYMYALSRGGMDLVEVVDSMADAEDAYGAVSEEFDTVRRDVEVFGADPTTALRNLRNTTPSGSLERFADDLLAVLDSGGEVTVFFEEQSKKYLREARDRQEDFLETLSLLSELFVFGFVALPLFVTVTLMIISFVGGQTLGAMAVLIYLALPAGMVAFLVVVDRLSAPYVQPEASVEDESEPTPDEETDDPRVRRYRRGRRGERLRALARRPLPALHERPVLSLVVTVPVALGLAAATVIGGYAEPSLAGVTGAPVTTTTLLVVVPLLVVAVPLSYLHERRRARRAAIVERFPDTLNVLSSANAMGVGFSDALALVSQQASGSLARELRKVHNDIEWNHDPRRALLSFAARLRVPHLSRTIKLIADGSRSSDDLSRILSVAAEDTRNRARLDDARRRAMDSYIAIVLIGFLVYLLVIVLIESSYLARFAELSAQQDATPGGPSLPITVTNVPVETYRALFFHSVLVQGFGAGVLAGKLADNDALAGLKYSIALVMLSVLVFVVV